MPCLILALALLAPRIALVLLWLLTDVLSRAFDTVLWPILGFVFMPFLTLAYAFAQTSGSGIQGIWLVIVVLAALADLGALGGGVRRRSAT